MTTTTTTAPVVHLADDLPADRTALLYYRGWEDGPLCPCGNTTSDSGFVSLEAPDNRPSDLSRTSPDRLDRIMCAACGRVFTDDNDTHTAQLRLVNGEDHYVEYAPADGFGAHVTTLSDEDRRATVAAWESLNNL